MWLQKTTNSALVYFNDDSIRFIDLARDEKGFYIKHFDEAVLGEGVIKNGEIIKAQLFLKIVQKIGSRISSRRISFVVPHQLAVVSEMLIKHPQASRVSEREIMKNVSKRFDEEGTTDVLFDVLIKERGDSSVLVETQSLSKHIYDSYVHIFTKTGLGIENIMTDVTAVARFIPEQSPYLLHVGHNVTQLAHVTTNHITQVQKFSVSYRSLVEDILQVVDMDRSEAWRVFDRYGVSHGHAEPKVHRKLVRSMGPLLNFFRSQRLKSPAPMYVYFADHEIPGFADIIKKTTQTDIEVFNVMKLTQYPMHEILGIHKKDLNIYTPLICAGMYFWK